jgi:putative CocE/NonD family hydrolase
MTTHRRETDSHTAHEGAPLFDDELVDDDAVARALAAHYGKAEHQIPMRDGTRLFTVIYAPRDRSRDYPFLLLRSPFGVAPYGVDVYPTPSNTLARLAPLGRYVRDGYIFVYQDVRGRMMSEGDFVDMRPYIPDKQGEQHDESSDAWDTIAWLLRSIPGHNGRVGVWGISYPGFYAAQAAIDAHPALVAVSPQAPTTEWFIGDDFHHHGALFLADGFGFSASLARTARHATQMTWGFEYDCGDIYDFFLRMGPLANANRRYFHGQNRLWDELMAHGTRDAYWRVRDPRPHYRDLKPAVLIVGGWFDEADLFGTLASWRSMQAERPKSDLYLAMGPWAHGGWAENDGERLGAIAFGSNTSRWFREHIEHPFLRHYLKGLGAPPPKVAVFETGSNVWRSGASWPPAGASPLTLWLDAGQTLRAQPPVDTGAAQWDEYVSDPAKPVPCHALPMPAVHPGYMIEDQRFAARRPDVLVYQTDELQQDLTLAGPIEADLWVSVSGSDADFVVKLIDVHPDRRHEEDASLAGYQQLVRAEVMRGKFRDGYESPTPFRPGEPARVRFALPDVSHTFRSGHRLMIQIQSSWFPLVDRNPQVFVDIYAADASDFRAAVHRVYRAPAMPSRISVTVQEREPRLSTDPSPAREH